MKIGKALKAICALVIVSLLSTLDACGKAVVSHDVPQIIWGVHSFEEDKFSERWQDEFNLLLQSKGIKAEVQFRPVILNREKEKLEMGSYRQYGEILAKYSAGCDIVTDLGHLGYYYCYPNYAKKGFYEKIDSYFDTEAGKTLRESYPEIFWKAMNYYGSVYAVPSQEELYFSNYYVVEKELADRFLIKENVSSELDLLALAEKASKEDGVIYKVAFGELPAPYGYEYDMEGMALFITEKDGSYQSVPVLEQKEFYNTLCDYQEFSKKNIWTADLNLAEDYVFGYAVSSYSEKAAVRYVCEENGWDSEKYCAVKTGDRPFRFTGNTTGILAESENKDLAFQVLAAVYSDKDLANMLVYGKEGINYKWKEEQIEIESFVTEEGQINTRYMTNHMLLYPTTSDDKERNQVLNEYYIGLPQSIQCGKWIDYEGQEEMIKKCEDLYGDRMLLFCGITDNLEEEINEVTGLFEQAGGYELSRIIEEQMNEQ